MRLVHLSVSDFRNLEAVEIEVASGINIFHGSNGAGKTSILEAVFVVSRGRSFRSQRLHEAVRQGAESSWIAARIGQDASTRTSLGVGVERSGQRVLKVGDEPVSKVSRMAALLPVQLMASDASTLVFGSPSWRRQWMDWVLFHVEPDLAPVFARYEQALRQRNSLLRQVRDGAVTPDVLTPWELLLAQHGERIQNARQGVVASVAPHIKGALVTLDQPFEVDFDVFQGWSIERELSADLVHRRDRDIAVGYTTSGVHRGDLQIRVTGRPGGRSLSRGQGKAVAAAMVLGQFDYLRDRGRFDGVLLIDDFSAEFDAEVRERFVHALRSRPFQVLATGVDGPDGALHPRPVGSASFHVKQGVVYRDG